MKKQDRGSAIELIKIGIKNGKSREEISSLLNGVGYQPSPGRKWTRKSVGNFIDHWRPMHPGLDEKIVHIRKIVVSQGVEFPCFLEPGEIRLIKEEQLELGVEESTKNEPGRNESAELENNNDALTDTVVRIVGEIVQLKIPNRRKFAAIVALTSAEFSGVER